MKNFNLLDSFATEKIYLTLGGFYPTKTIKYKSLYYLSFIFNLSISWCQFLSMFTFAYFKFSDIEKVSEIFLFCMTQFAFLNKLTNFITQKSNLTKLEAMLQNHLLSNVTEQEEVVLKSQILKGRMVAKMFRVLCFLTVLFYALFPILDERDGQSHRFPLPCWFPFDENRYYYQVYFCEILSIAVGAWINSNIDILTMMMCIVVTAQFDILRDRLVAVLSVDVEDNMAELRLRNCAIHYGELLSLVKQLELTFSKGIFIQFVCTVIVICMTGFQMIIISFCSMQFVLLVVYFSCMMCQVVMYCFYGHTVMESSDKVSDACYMSQWNGANLRVQKSLLLIMERAKRPATIRAGNFFVLNIPTLMTILRSSYSYFAVLQRVYGKKN